MGLFDYYFHKKIKQNETLKLNKNVKLIAFNDHFSKYVIGNKLVLRKKWISLHPKLKNLLIDDLTHGSIQYGNVQRIKTSDLSFNDVGFGLNGMKFVCDTINKSSVQILKIAKNDLDFKCIQLFVISILSTPKNHFCALTELNISYNLKIDDNALHLLLNKGIAQKCHNLKTLYVQWTSISSLATKYIVEFYTKLPYHSLSELYLNGNKNITSQGAIVLNAALQGILKERKDVVINISDCKQINVSKLIKFDHRLIVNT